MQIERHSATVWDNLREFLRLRTGGKFGRVDLHDTTLAIRARRAYCAEHGLILSFDAAKGINRSHAAMLVRRYGDAESAG